MERKLVSVETLAGAIEFKPNQLRELARRKKIPAYKIGHFWRFDMAEVASWINARRNQPDSI